jgi:prepilin-type N-terminal cleavage/methylation domain-containing protein
MIRSKNNTGFTLIEVLFAMAIIGIVLTPLIINQGNLLRWVARQSAVLYRTYLGEQFMIDSYIKFEQDNRQRSITKRVEDPEITLIFRIEQASPAIKKLFRNTYTQKVTIEWEEVGTKYSDKLVTFLFLPELKK